jgi:hypothetical protein
LCVERGIDASDYTPSANHDEAVLNFWADLKRNLKLLLHQGSQGASVISIGGYTLGATQVWFGPSHGHPNLHNFRFTSSEEVHAQEAAFGVDGDLSNPVSLHQIRVLAHQIWFSRLGSRFNHNPPEYLA